MEYRRNRTTNFILCCITSSRRRKLANSTRDGGIILEKAAAGCLGETFECKDQHFRRAGTTPILGGLGITDDTIVARLFRDVRPFRIYDGPSEAHRWSIARRALRAGNAGA